MCFKHIADPAICSMSVLCRVYEWGQNPTSGEEDLVWVRKVPKPLLACSLPGTNL